MTKFRDFAKDNADLVSGLVFRATLQLRTPLKVLERHGEVHADLSTEPPCYAPEGWEGYWAIKTKTWAELGGVNLPEFGGAGVASDIGPQPGTGEAYCGFLVAVRRIYESDWGDQSARVAAIAAEIDRPEWSAFVQRHGGLAPILKGLKRRAPRSARLPKALPKDR